MSKSGNVKLLVFVGALSLTCAVTLAGIFVALKPRTDMVLALEQKTKILGAVMDVSGMKGTEIDSIYASRIVALVLDKEGNIITGIDPASVNVEAEYKSGNPTKFPLYNLKSEVDPANFESCIMPLYGNGLWDNIWGFVSVGGDFNTITGAVFDHKAETPGLGARITEPDVQARFVGKKIFKENGTFKGVKMQKGEGKDYSDNPHQVDGMSGASMTGSGLNDMLITYLQYYQPFFAKQQKGTTSSAAVGGSSKIDRKHK